VPIDGRRRFLGRIAGVDGDKLTLELETGPIALAIADIEKAKLVPSFEPASASRSSRKGKKHE
jgi:ribosome maturation factor RimP